MTAQVSYGQFCPVAKASELLARRWTPLVMRELISGSAGFNEIHRGVPLMSRALLSQRLKELEAAGVIRHDDTPAYRLTEAGEELAPVIIAMGVWGQRWVESATDGPDWDAGVLMWDMRRRIDTAALPPGRTLLQFDYADAPAEMRRWSRRTRSTSASPIPASRSISTSSPPCGRWGASGSAGVTCTPPSPPRRSCCTAMSCLPAASGAG